MHHYTKSLRSLLQFLPNNFQVSLRVSSFSSSLCVSPPAARLDEFVGLNSKLNRIWWWGRTQVEHILSKWGGRGMPPNGCAVKIAKASAVVFLFSYPLTRRLPHLTWLCFYCCCSLLVFLPPPFFSCLSSAEETSLIGLWLWFFSRFDVIQLTVNGFLHITISVHCISLSLSRSLALYISKVVSFYYYFPLLSSSHCTKAIASLQLDI